jgi:hypothetical protein
MEVNRDVEVALSHEFWCCKKSFETFAHSATMLLITESKKETRLEAFTAYGNFIRHLYVFYEGVIKYRNADMLEGAKTAAAIGKKMSELMSNEVRKLIRNKALVYQSRPELDSREMLYLVESEVPDAFGVDFRQMRNRFSHSATSRVNKKELTLDDFFKRYHGYMLLLYDTCAFSWTIKNVEQYDWQEIDSFFDTVRSNPQ